MASLKSMKIILDKKQKKKRKSISSIDEIEPHTPRRPPTPEPFKSKSKTKSKPKSKSRISKIKEKFNWNDYIHKEPKARKEVPFAIACAGLPMNSRVAYILNRTFINRAGEQQNVYCNSAFYKGVIEVESCSICEGKKLVKEKQMIMRVGKKLYYLGDNDIKTLYVYMDQGDLLKKQVKQCKDNIRDIRGKSLPIIDGGTRSRNSTNDLLRDSMSRVSNNDLLNDVTRNRNSASNLLRDSMSRVSNNETSDPNTSRLQTSQSRDKKKPTKRANSLLHSKY